MALRRVLITGGAGFLGSHLVEALRDAATSVRLFDFAECPDWAGRMRVEYLRGDICDQAARETALDNVSAVVHAAFASPRQTREQIQRINVEATEKLCAAALARQVHRLLLISSTIVVWPRRVHPVFSNSPLTRLDEYRRSRIEAEQIVAEYARRGLSVAVVRPKTFIGPGRVSAFTILFDWIRGGMPVPVLGTGKNRYQLLDIRDMAEGIRLLVSSEAQGVFFFGAREFRTVREDLQALLDHARTGSRLRFVPPRLARMVLRAMELANMVAASEWHYMSTRGADSIVDTSRAERELGWQPRSSNAQALQAAYDWYVAMLTATGTAKTTHPLPLGHRILKGLFGILPR